MTKPETKCKLPNVSTKEALDTVNLVNERALAFNGNFDELEKATGMLLLGKLYGWKVLVFMHNKRTIRKYENILGINIRDYFDEEGPLTTKAVSYEFVKAAGTFWKAVSGDVKVENRRDLNKG